MASATAARVMEINIKLHLAELVRGMEERAAAQSESAANRRAISIRGLDLGARVDFSNAQRGEITIIAPIRQTLRLEARVRTVPQPKTQKMVEHAMVRAQKWQAMLETGLVPHRLALAKRVGCTPGAVTKILRMIRLVPEIQAYLASIKNENEAWHFSAKRMAQLASLEPEFQRAAFAKLRNEYSQTVQPAQSIAVGLDTGKRNTKAMTKLSIG